ncbi:DUF397 domain-containing protein [Actinomadura harenae]|uniref:DUF397 domain-containing protein n=1 Tax=Actinomadura harenae TaxID=2483351 RepID=UPI001F311A63|nr:DUF397 domain-containing protein [Actinomadura harenae]
MDLPNVTWRKARRSGGSGGSCVEVATQGSAHLARDSKDPMGPVLAFTGAEWGALLFEVKAGAHDLS